MTEPAARSRPMVRALFRAVAVPGATVPHQSLHAKIYYPAMYSGTPLENNTGSVPAAVPAAPYPVAILMPGINVGHEAYGWLAAALAEAGFVTLIYGWIVEEMPGLVSLSPGLDLTALAPKAYGTRPSANALAAVIGELHAMNAQGPLAGLLDLDRILLGGHSAGGSVALMNARPDWFPGLRAVFAYGAHSKASTMLGYPADALLPLADALPLLILGGSEDGVIAASAFRYGADGTQAADPSGPVARTFHEGISRNADDCYLAIVRGANHFALAWSADTATGRPFLDWPLTRPADAIRETLAALIAAFARAHVADAPGAVQELRTLLKDEASIQQSAVR
jgi:hypothetical protein